MEKISNIIHSQTDYKKNTNLISLLTKIDQNNEVKLKNLLVYIANHIEPNFILDKYLKVVFADLFRYFLGNNGTYDLNKGIYIFGDYGVGKTLTMTIFSKFLANAFPFSPNGFWNLSIEQVADHFKKKGNMLKFGRGEDRLDNPRKICFNEFGKPINEKHYGSDIQNVINSMLMTRYELFQNNGIITHATSNFRPDELAVFDDALMDRFKQMFNFIELNGDSKR